MADAVAGAEILVGVVVEGAPADGAGDCRVAIGGVEHLQMADDVFGLPLLLVVALGRVHVTIELGDHVGNRLVEPGDLALRAERRARPVAAKLLIAEDEVVHRVNVLEHLAVGDEADPARLPGRIERMGEAIGLDVEVVTVLQLVDPHPPQDDRGMVPVARDHAADVLDRLGLPRVAADVLPAGNLLEDEQAKPVAGIEEPGRLRIVGRADDVEVKLALQDFGVAFLGGAAKGIAGIGKGLVAIEAAQLQRPAVEAKALGCELGRAEAEGVGDRIVAEGELNRVEIGAVEVPKRDALEPVHLKIDVGCGGRGRRAIVLPCGVAKRRRQGAGERQVLRIVEVDADADATFWRRARQASRS